LSAASKGLASSSSKATTAAITFRSRVFGFGSYIRMDEENEGTEASPAR
jgi:hypothetical protein